MEFKKLALSVAIATSLMATGCGGGGASSSSSSSPDSGTKESVSTRTLTGMAAKGAIQNGIATVSELVSGAWIQRGQARTGSDGKYSVTMKGYQDGPLKVVVTVDAASTMKCDAEACDGDSFGDAVAVPTDFVMETIIPQAVDTDVPVSPLTHMVAANIEQLLSSDPAGFTAAQITDAEARFAAQFNVANVLTTPLVDITDTTAFAAAKRDTQLASTLAASAMKLADNSVEGLPATLTKMASAYQDGDFSVSDALTSSELVQAINDTVDDEAVAAVLKSSSVDVKGALLNVAAAMDQRCPDNNCTAIAAVDTSLTPLEKAKDLVRASRSLVYNFIDNDFDDPLSSLGNDLHTEVFNRNAGAVSQVMGAVLGKVSTVLFNDTQLQTELVIAGKLGTTVTRDLVITLEGEKLGTLKLVATNSPKLALTIKGALNGSEDATRTVNVDLAVNSSFAMQNLLAASVTKKTLTMDLQGSVGDSETSLAVNSGSLSARIAAPLSGSSDITTLKALSLNNLDVTLQSANGSFTGGASFKLVQSSNLSSYFYDGLPLLSLDTVALNGNVTTTSGETVALNAKLDVEDSDAFDLLAFLNSDKVINYEESNVLTEAQGLAIRKASLASSTTTGWAVNYKATNTYQDGALVHNESAESVDTAQDLTSAESYASFASIYDPEAVLAAKFTSFPDMRIARARVHVIGSGDTYKGSSLTGQIDLGSYETDDNYLKAELTTTLDISGVTGLPSSKVHAWVKRDRLAGGSADLLITLNGDNYDFYLQDVNLEKGKGKLTVTNPNGTKMVLSGVNFNSGKAEGVIYVDDVQVATVTTLNSGMIKISYTDGTMESLQ